MAVRRQPDSSEDRRPTIVELAKPLGATSAVVEMRRVIGECLKGIVAFPVAVAGVSLMWWSSKSEGFSYWLGTVSGLVIMAVGLAYVGEFIKQLIRGDLTKGAWAVIRRSAMKEWAKVFIASASMISGVCLVATARRNSFLDEWLCYCVGIVLMAGGITYFWMQSKFYSGE